MQGIALPFCILPLRRISKMALVSCGGRAVDLHWIKGLFLDREVQILGLALFYLAVETGTVTNVAGSAAVYLDLDEEAVLIIIDHELDHMLSETGLLALDPEFFAGAAVVGGLAGLDRELHGFTVHMSEHQHLSRLNILGDAGKNFVQIKTGKEFRAFLNLINGRCHKGG